MLTGNTLVTKAELIMEFKGYDKSSVDKCEELIDIVASEPGSDADVLIRIVKSSKLGTGVVGVVKARNMRDAIQEREVKTGVVLGERFTTAAKRVLKENSIEFFTTKQPVITAIDAYGLYVKINAVVKRLCEATCGRYPSSAAECQGISTEPDAFLKYPCRIRHLSDNADVHFEHRWFRMLREDLRELLIMTVQMNHRETDEEPPLDGHAEP